MRSPRSFKRSPAAGLGGILIGFASLYASSQGAAWAQNASAKAPIAASDPRMRAGMAIYKDTCMACHQSNGAGVVNLFPKLAKSDVVQQDDASWPIAIVLQGGKVGATDSAPTGAAMPSLRWRLSDDQIANVLTYVRNSWGNVAPAVKAASVKMLR